MQSVALGYPLISVCWAFEQFSRKRRDVEVQSQVLYVLPPGRIRDTMEAISIGAAYFFLPPRAPQTF